MQYQRSGCDEQYLPERRSGSKIFAGTAFRHHYTPAVDHFLSNRLKLPL